MANRSIQTDPEPEVTVRFSDRQLVWALMAFAAVLYAIAAKMRLGMPPLGDEPHYLIESIALGKYHTFDLTQAYANGDYRVFYPMDIQAHVYPNADGVMVPLHNFGGPILWTIPFMIWGRVGAQAVVVLASVLTVGVTFRIMREMGIARQYAAIVSGLFIVATPIYMYASMLFIDPFGALFVAYAIRVLVAARPAKWQVALASAGLGWMPWVHGRFTLFTVILGVLLLLRVDRGGARGLRALAAYVPAAVPMLVLLLALEIFNYTHYQSLNPAPGNSALGDGLLQIPPQRGLAGILFDRQYGLISHFPLLALAVPGMFLVGRRRGRMQSHWMLLAVILPYMLAISTFRTWWAGFTPPGRLPVVLVPILAFYVAVTLQRLHSWLPLALALATSTFGFVYTFTGDLNLFWRFSSSGGHGNDPLFTWLAGKIRQPAIARFIPAVQTDPGTGENYWPFVFAFAACVLVAVAWGRFLAPADRIPDRTLWNYLPTPRELLASVRRRPAPGAVTPPVASEAPAPAAPAVHRPEPEPVHVPAAGSGEEAEADKRRLEWPFPPADRTP